jgi:cyanophycin synthetase
MQSALQLLLAAVHDRPLDVEGETKRLRLLADRICLGPSSKAILDAAREQGIPWRRLNAGSLVQLGQGAKQRRIWTAETDRTSSIGATIAQDKQLTRRLLQAVGVPVPEGRAVADADDAWAAALEIGLPVVVKPRDANHARGVFIDLKTEDEVRRVFPLALQEGDGVLVERFARGREHRLLVVGHRLAAASGGAPVTVAGDGVQTVAELIESQLNSDPRRGDDEFHPLSLIDIDPPVLQELERQELGLESVPAAGRVVMIQRFDTLSHDVTDRVHPLVAEQAVLAARTVGLDVAGLDVVVEDISRPLEEQGGAFIEVNAGPGLVMHLFPATGHSRPVGKDILALLFPAWEDGRIPLAAVSGSAETNFAAHLLTDLWRKGGRRLGLAARDGRFVGPRRVDAGDATRPTSARNLLLDPTVEGAVFETDPLSILREGLAFDRCEVAVVTSVGRPDGLEVHDVRDVEKLTAVLRTPVDVVLPRGTAVLNFADEHVASMAPACKGSVAAFSTDPDDPRFVEHRTRGGRSAFVRDGALWLATGMNEERLLDLREIPSLASGTPDARRAAVLGATAAAWILGVPNADLAAALREFAAPQTPAPRTTPDADATVALRPAFS